MSVERYNKVRGLINMANIVAFIGVIGSGKSHAAKEYTRDGYRIINFADALKDIAGDIFGMSGRDEKFKAMSLYRPHKPVYEEFEDEYFHMVLDGRQVLQNLGESLRRRIHPCVWVDLLESHIKFLEHAYGEDTKIVVGDCRNKEEVESLMKKNAKFIFVNYKSVRYDSTNSHTSEHLAQQLLRMGLEDRQVIEYDDLRKAIKVLGILESQQRRVK